MLKQPQHKNDETNAQRAYPQDSSHARKPLLKRGLRRLLCVNHVGDMPHLRIHPCFRNDGARMARSDGAGGKHAICPVSERALFRQVCVRLLFHRQGFPRQGGFFHL